MKKILFFAMALSIVLGCKKTSYVEKFDKLPQERAAEQISLVSSTLTSSANGWVATLPTQAGGGYGFYMNFESPQDVLMLSDITTESATKGAKSYYRVKQDMGTELVFDTYNYISLLNDPNGTLGGANKIGYSSDVEFTFNKISGDTIIFVGKKFRQPLRLLKATADQKASYLAGNLVSAIDKFKNFFSTNANRYIELGSGANLVKVGITANSSNNLANGKRIDFTGVMPDGKTIKSSNTKYSFNLNGADLLNNGLIFEGVTFVKFTWKDDTTLALYDSTGKEYIVKNSATPLIPLYLLWGTKYAGMLSEYKTIYPGTSAAGAEILNYYHDGLVPPLIPYRFNYGRINLVWNTVNQRLIVNGFSSQNGGTSGWITASGYNYTVDANGVYKFTEQSSPSGGYVSVPLTKLYQFLLNNSVKFDYFAEGGITYGQMSSVENPGTVMTFVLQ